MILFFPSKIVRYVHNRVCHLVVDPGWVVFNLRVPPYCLAASAYFTHQPKHNTIDNVTLQTQVNKTQSMTRRDALYFSGLSWVKYDLMVM